MARVYGPLHSDSASGKFAGSLVYSHWKGARAYVRELVTPKNPKSAKQTGIRAMFGFVAAAWKNIGSTPQASWSEQAEAAAISAFDAFVKVAMNLWQAFTFPQKTYNDTRDSVALTVTTQTTTGGVGTATVEITPSGSTAIWGIAIFRGDTGFTPGWNNCIAVLPADGANPVEWIDSPLDPGSYYYRACVFNDDGVVGTIHAESAEVVVT